MTTGAHRDRSALHTVPGVVPGGPADAAAEGRRRAPAPRGGADVERRLVPHHRSGDVRCDRVGTRPLAGHVLAGRRGDRGWDGPLAVPRVVPVRYAMTSAGQVRPVHAGPGRVTVALIGQWSVPNAKPEENL